MSRACIAAALLLAFVTTLRADAAEFRLPREVAPTGESVRLHIDPDRPAYSGDVRVELQVAAGTDSVCFHAEGQELTAIRLTQSGRALSVTRQGGPDGLQTLHLAQPLERGPAMLEIDFTRPLGTRSVGLYRTVRDGRGYVFSQFESADGRKAFPCWDEPAFKIPWQVTLDVPRTQQAVSNAPVEREVEGDSTKTIVFARTPALPSYLVAIAVGPLEFTPRAGHLDADTRRHDTGSVAPRGTHGRDHPPAARRARALVRLAPPLRKLDLIARAGLLAAAPWRTPAPSSSRRHPARRPRAPRRPRNCAATSRDQRPRAGTHVVWRPGDDGWWDDLWLNESFADWMATRSPTKSTPSTATASRTTSACSRCAPRTCSRRRARSAIRGPAASPGS